MVCEEADRIADDYLRELMKGGTEATQAESRAKARLRRLADAPADPELRRVLRRVVAGLSSPPASSPPELPTAAAPENAQRETEFHEACRPYWGRASSLADVQGAPDEASVLYTYRRLTSASDNLEARFVEIDDEAETATVELTDEGMMSRSPLASIEGIWSG
jgi:hypothetical protein